MPQSILAISALLLAAIGMNMGFGLQATLLGIRAGMEHFPVIATGLIMALYYVGFASASRFVPPLVNSVGHIRTFAALASIASTAAALHAVFVFPASWAILRTISGFCLAGLFMVVESWLNNASTNTERGRLLSTYMVCTLSGTALGQILLNLAPPQGANLFILVSVLLSLALVPVALTRNPAPPITPPARMSIVDLFRKTPLGVANSLTVGILNGCLWGLGALYAHEIYMTTFQTSLFMLCAVLGALVAQWPLGRLSDRLDRRKVILAMSLLIAVTAAVVATLGYEVTDRHFLVIALFGSVSMPLYAIGIAHGNDVLTSDEFVPGAAGLLLSYGVGAAAGPILGGLAMMAVGAPGLFAVMAAVGLANAVFAGYRVFKGTAVPVEDRETFVAVPRTTPEAFTLHPQYDSSEPPPAHD